MAVEVGNGRSIMMMQFKKIGIGIFLALSLMVTHVTVFAMDRVDTTQKMTDSLNPAERGAYFSSFSGTIQSVEKWMDSQMILVKNSNGQIANLVVSEDTYRLSKDELAVGAEITGFFETNAPMIMIYPPRYNVDIIAVNFDGLNVKVDRFDSDFVSKDGTLKLNISDDTEIVFQNGEKFTGDLGSLANRKLIVLYKYSTRSIPAQTTPEKIIVLYEKAVPPIGQIDNGMDLPKISGLVVNDKVITAPSPYFNESGVVMVPLRPVADILGLDVKWDGTNQSIVVDKNIAFKIGMDRYERKDTQAILQIGAAPELKNGMTFVPLNFFKDALRMNNAYLFEGQVDINNGEVMN